VLVTDGIETVTATLSPVIIGESFGFSPTDYTKMSTEEKKNTMKEATSKLASKLVKILSQKYFT
jgi:hypothetical protein